MDLSRSFLYLRVKITQANSANIAGGDEVGPINLPIHSAFSHMELELGGRVISDSNGLYPYRAYLETLLNLTGGEQQLLQLESALWKKDTSERFLNFATANGSPNEGLVARAQNFRRSNEVELVGRQHLDIFHQTKLILPNVSLRLRMIPSQNNFLLVSPAPVAQAVQNDYRFEILEARFCVYTIEVTNNFSLSHEQLLLKGNARFPIKRVTMKHLSIPQGHQSALYDNVFLGTLPTRILMGMVTDAAMAGGYQQNSFNFEHFNLSYLSLYVNGEQYPSKPFAPDFAANRYLREYSSIFDGDLSQCSNSKSVSISRAEYAHGYTLFLFNLSPDPNARNCITPSRNGSVRKELKFSQATAQTINLILYAEFDSLIEIDKFRNIIGPF
jgi:hypothetical protein